jgi:hypothetical protein
MFKKLLLLLLVVCTGLSAQAQVFLLEANLVSPSGDRAIKPLKYQLYANADAALLLVQDTDGNTLAKFDYNAKDASFSAFDAAKNQTISYKQNDLEGIRAAAEQYRKSLDDQMLNMSKEQRLEMVQMLQNRNPNLIWSASDYYETRSGDAQKVKSYDGQTLSFFDKSNDSRMAELVFMPYKKAKLKAKQIENLQQLLGFVQLLSTRQVSIPGISLLYTANHGIMLRNTIYQNGYPDQVAEVVSIKSGKKVKFPKFEN